MSAGEDALDGELLLHSLNYHGQQLTGFIGESTMGRAAVLRNVNYHLYQSRSKELRMEDRGKRMQVHRFISQNADFLFARNYTKAQDVNTPTEVKAPTAGPLLEITAPLPPLEAFLPSMSEEDRAVHFYDLIEIGDSLCCRVIAKNMSGLMLQILCFGGTSSKSRHLEDMKLRCICPAADVTEEARPFEIGDLAEVAVSDVRRDSQRMLVSMKTDNLPEAVRSKIKLGLIESSGQLPLLYRCTKDALEKGVSYDVILERSTGFLNPSNVSVLAQELGLTTKVSSASMTLRHGFLPEECAVSLRRKQNAKWALGHVAAGIRYFKTGNTVEAFQALNQALRIDPENVEGLVARGALFANNNALEKAVSDFNEALKLDPIHRNANKYLSETLCAMARNLEGEEKLDEAGELYEKILTKFPDCQDAKESLQFLKRLKAPPEGPSLAIRKDIFDPSSNMMAAKNNDNVFEASANEGRKGVEGGLSPFSQKMREASEALKMSGFSATNPSAENIQQGQVPSQGGPLAGMMSFALPPPGYGVVQYPSVPVVQHGYRNDTEYDRAVNAFLRQTSSGAGAPSSSSSARRKRSRSRSRSRSPPAAYRARDPDDLRNRIRARSRSRDRQRSRSRDRRTSAGRNRSKERSSRRTREDSRERDKERSGRRSRSRDRERRKSSRGRSKERSTKDDVRSSREKNSAGKSDKNKADDGVGELNVDAFAERLSNYFKSKEAKEAAAAAVAAAPSTSKDREIIAAKKHKKVSAEELEIVVKDLPKRSEDLRSPRVRAAFTGSDEEGAPTMDVPGPVDTNKKKGIVVNLWRPVGSRKEDDDNRDGDGRRQSDRNLSSEESSLEQRRNRFDQEKSLEFVIRVDPITGMYVRVPKDPLDSTAQSETSSRNSAAKEKRSVRKRSVTPEDRRRRRSRSRSRGRRRSDRSRSRSPRKRRDSGEQHRKDSRFRRPSPPSSKAGSSSSTNKDEFRGLRNESLSLDRERERLAKEKKELLAIQRLYDYSRGSDIGLPRPVPSSSSPPGGGSSAWGAHTTSRFDSRDVVDLRDVLRSSSGSGSAASRPIIAGATTFEDVEDVLARARREKKEELRERNKDFIKPKAW